MFQPLSEEEIRAAGCAQVYWAVAGFLPGFQVDVAIADMAAEPDIDFCQAAVTNAVAIMDRYGAPCDEDTTIYAVLYRPHDGATKLCRITTADTRYWPIQ